MRSNLIIHNLEESVKQKLLLQAVSHGRSMEAEAREILTRPMNGASPATTDTLPSSVVIGVAANGKGKFDHVIGIWKGGMSTDEIMQYTRAE
jgi:plasmid stability protein